jgi:peptidyl-prolyl cis-trans isomerase D
MRKIVIKIVTFAIFGVLIASFAVWGIGDVFRASQPDAPVATVGDIEIGQREFSRSLTREVNRLSARLGSRFDIEQARALGVVDQVVGQLVGGALFDQKVAELGITVSDKLIKQRIADEPAFKNSAGQFDPNLFIQTLQASNMGEQEFVERLRRDVLRQQLIGAITESAPAPRTVAETLYSYREETRTARVLRVPNDSIVDLPEPDEPALQAFHKEFSSKFMAPEYRAIVYVQLRAKDLASEIAVSEADVEQEFEARRDEFAVPERRDVDQIVFDDEAAATAAMDSFRDGVNFETVAQDLTGQPPVDLGTIERDGLPEELSDVAFNLKEGEIGEPVETGFGWHILRVRKIQPGEEASLEKVREELTQDLALTRAVDSIVSLANQLDDELAGGASLSEAAASLNLEVRRIAAIDRNGRDDQGKPVQGFPPERFLEVAFDTAPGQDSLMTETSDGDFFILNVSSVTSAQLRPLGEVRAEVVKLWQDARRAEKAREIANALAERARLGASLEELGKETGYKVEISEPLSRFETDPTRSFASALTSKLFDLAPNEVDTVAATDSHLVLQLVEVTKVDPASKATEVAALREGLSNAMRNDLLEQFVGTLRAEYGVTVDQVVIDNVMATF